MPFFIGTGIILLIILGISFLGSAKFSSLASDKGYSAKKAKRYPWVIAAATLTLMLLGQMILSFFTPYEIWLGWGLFTVLLMVTVLRKAYKNMQLAPSKDELAAIIAAEKLEITEHLDPEENP
jgi:cell division protein FtsW (lipid II flippase)